MTDQPTPSGQARPPVDPSGVAAPPPPPPGYAPMAYGPPPAKRSTVAGKLITSVLTTIFLISLLLNFYLGAFFVSQTSGPTESSYSKGDSANRIVILPVSGLIDDTMYSFLHNAFEQLKKNPPKAVVLRIDSGGGYVSPSDRIWHELVEFKKETGVPVVSSFASVAASGAYYIGSASDVIVIEPTGLTGSIGVIAQGFTVENLLDKIGVTPEIVTSTDSVDKDELNPMRAWTEKDRDVITGILNNAYEQFVEVVYEGRKEIDFDGKQYGLTMEQVRELATGAVFTADEAKENMLVDQVGYLGDAIAIAKDKAGIAADITPQVNQMRRPGGFGLLGMVSSDTPSLGAWSADLDADKVRGWLAELSTPKLEYRWHWE